MIWIKALAVDSTAILRVLSNDIILLDDLVKSYFSQLCKKDNLYAWGKIPKN